MIVAKKYGKSGTIVASRLIIRGEYEAQKNKGTRRILRKIANREEKRARLNVDNGSLNKGETQD